MPYFIRSIINRITKDKCGGRVNINRFNFTHKASGGDSVYLYTDGLPTFGGQREEI